MYRNLQVTLLRGETGGGVQGRDGRRTLGCLATSCSLGLALSKQDQESRVAACLNSGGVYEPQLTRSWSRFPPSPPPPPPTTTRSDAALWCVFIPQTATIWWIVFAIVSAAMWNFYCTDASGRQGVKQVVFRGIFHRLVATVDSGVGRKPPA